MGSAVTKSWRSDGEAPDQMGTSDDLNEVVDQNVDSASDPGEKDRYIYFMVPTLWKCIESSSDTNFRTFSFITSFISTLPRVPSLMWSLLGGIDDVEQMIWHQDSS